MADKTKEIRLRNIIDQQPGSEKLWADGRIAAIRVKQTMSAWVWDAIREKLERDAKKK